MKQEMNKRLSDNREEVNNHESQLKFIVNRVDFS